MDLFGFKGVVMTTGKDQAGWRHLRHRVCVVAGAPTSHAAAIPKGFWKVFLFME